MLLVVVVTALALAVIVLVIHREDRTGSSVQTAAAPGERVEDLDAAALAEVPLPRAVLGYEPAAVRQALAAAARLAERSGADEADAEGGAGADARETADAAAIAPGGDGGPADEPADEPRRADAEAHVEEDDDHA